MRILLPGLHGLEEPVLITKAAEKAGSLQFRISVPVVTSNDGGKGGDEIGKGFHDKKR